MESGTVMSVSKKNLLSISIEEDQKMFKVTMSKGWNDIQFEFEEMVDASIFMAMALDNHVPNDGVKIAFTVEKSEIEEETEDAEDVCGTEEG